MAYSKIERRTWNDERFRQWPKRRRDMWLYLLTTPHLDQAGGRIGCFVLDPLYATADLSAPDDQWDPKEVVRQLEALATEGRIMWDPDSRLVLLMNFFRHNRPENPNVAVAASRDVDEIPFSQTLLKGLISAAEKHLPKRFDGGKPLGEAIIEAALERLSREGVDNPASHSSDSDVNDSEGVAETAPKGLAQPFPKQEHEHEHNTSSSPSTRARGRQPRSRDLDLSRLKEYLGPHAAAADRFATSADHATTWPSAIMGLYGPNGTDELVWRNTPPDSRAALLAVTLDRYAGEGSPYNARYFRRFLEAVVAERDRPARSGPALPSSRRRRRQGPPQFDYSNAATAGERIEWPK